jgi:signal transduction histidine kinase
VTAGLQVRLAENCEVTIFRIIRVPPQRQEARSATRVVVRLLAGQSLGLLSVVDNGKGFDIPDSVPNLATGGRLGLLGIRERATVAGGSCSISSRPGKGTRVAVRLPVSCVN